uniref:Uncharacterized protein n=1 Tax=Setaria italica TaxID=4555 RepID=K3Z1B4_SETIT
MTRLQDDKTADRRCKGRGKHRTDLLRVLLLYRIAECSKIRFAG